jgi:thiol-disulfide isomerase/thioredoxin
VASDGDERSGAEGDMSVYRVVAMLICSAVGAGIIGAQTAPGDQADMMPFAALSQPACPVSGAMAPAPIDKEIRVLYFPQGYRASIKDPKSLTLHLVFDHGGAPEDGRTASFVRREDGVWVATVPLNGWNLNYAVYWVEDRDSKAVDTNGGKYFEVPFCTALGKRAEFSVKYEAMSYTGVLESYGIERRVDYAKAIQVLEEFIYAPLRGQSLIAELWTYKLHLGGGTAETRAKLLTEINKFISEHSTDGFGLVDALNFVAYEDWIPAETTEKLVNALERKDPDDQSRVFLLIARAAKEKDETKRNTLYWQIVNQYPDSMLASSARITLLITVKDLEQREKLYQQEIKTNPHDPYLHISMAGAYLEAKQKLPEALTQLDEADKLFDESARAVPGRMHVNEWGLKAGKQTVMILRAEVLLDMGKPAEALAILLPRKSEFKRGHSYYLLGEALEGTGDKRVAAEAYLESVVRPSKDQEKAEAALQRLWRSEKIGSTRELQQQIAAKVAQNFSSAEYTPRVVGHPAPEFEVTTLRGEHLAAVQLRGKTVVLNFWATWCGPCLEELPGLQEFQQKHPETVVLTMVDESTEPKALEDAVRDKKLTVLRVARVPSEFWAKFGAGGVPTTLIVDGTGNVRIQHDGSVPDMTRYFEADLKAIAEAGPVKAEQAAAR